MMMRIRDKIFRKPRKLRLDLENLERYLLDIAITPRLIPEFNISF